MPHIVVDGKTDYLGVRFVDGPLPEFGQSAIFEIELMYPDVDYSDLTPGVAITIREGARTVAFGCVTGGVAT